MKRFIILVLLCFAQGVLAQDSPTLIPYPKDIQFNKELFQLNANTKIVTTQNTSFEAQFLKDNIKEFTGLELSIVNKKPKSNYIYLSLHTKTNPTNESYNLAIANNKIEIASTSQKGIFYGIQTLSQYIPIGKSQSIVLKGVSIHDTPSYQWRGMHLDVSRHFFSTDFIKKYINYIAMYKMNTFHWHLTDDQGWRIEIKKYPKLTEVGAYRNGSMVGHYADQKFDSIRYGGFYTQDQIKDIVAYAQKRHITIVPEIEMPGHAQAALAAYPQYSCTDKPIEVAKTWGVLEDVFCPEEQTFTFLQDILDEVVTLFPSEYIHIGGDECPKTRWKNSEFCQNLMKEKGLKDEHELQSYFIQRIEKYLNTKGKKIIGWDEILEGGLAPNAAVMSWRGTEGGIAAAKQNHYVVMTPGSHCYFDHYQGNLDKEPIAIGGYTNLEKVYNYKITPDELTEEQRKYVLGSQGNVWTEYMYTPDIVEFRIMPRMAALSEVLWGTAKEYKEFQNRIIEHFKFYDFKGINYSKAIYDLSSEITVKDSKVFYKLKGINPSGICFTTNNTQPKATDVAYTDEIPVTKSQTIQATYFENGIPKSDVFSQEFIWSKSTAKKITLAAEPHTNYNVGGANTLVNGVLGKSKNYGKGWIGFSGKNLDATIDFSKLTAFSSVTINFYKAEGSWIYLPKKIEILAGNSLETMRKITEFTAIQSFDNKIIFPIQNAKYIQIKVENFGIIPDGKEGAGNGSWLFVDEIRVD